MKGKKFPQGDLIEGQFRAHVFNIVDFVTDEQTLALLLDFDSEAFFQTVVHIFSGKPWHYIIRGSKGYTFEFQKTEVCANGIKKQPSEDRRRFEEDEETDDPSILTMLAAQILFIFKKAADRSFRKDPAFTQSCFLELILRIIVAQDKENRN